MGSNDKSDVMPKVDFSQLKTAKKYAEIIEKENLERALKLRQLRGRNKWVGAILGAAVFSIYSYSILAVKQETFLDDFDEPAREPTQVGAGTEVTNEEISSRSKDAYWA